MRIWLKDHRRAALCALAITLALLLAAVLPSIAAGAGGGTHHRIAARYDDAAQTVAVSHTILYRNDYSTALNEIVLHAYPNAFADEKAVPFEPQDLSAAYPNGFSVGSLDISLLRVDGQRRLERPSGTLLTIPLSRSLKSGGVLRIEAEYTITLPDSRGRFGYGENTVNLLNAFLIPAVYEQSGWRDDAYSAIGDPFYSETMLYSVSLTAPEGYALASTGVVSSEKTSGGKTLWKIEAPLARDFAAVLSKAFVTQEATVDGIAILSHAFNREDASIALDIAADAVRTFQSRFGPSPYPQIEICSADFFIGGMECPGLAVIDSSLYRGRRDGFLEFCIAHEVAHQWFYGGVGSDQIHAPWLDESLTEYATLLYYQDSLGEEAFQSAYNRFVMPYLTLSGLSNEPVGQSITDFDSGYRYSAVVYAKGAAMWHDIRSAIGDDAFFSSLSNYYQAHLHETATEQSLLYHLPPDGQSLLLSWLHPSAP